MDHDDYLNVIRRGVCSKCSWTGPAGRESARSHMISTHLDYSCRQCRKGFFLQKAVDQHVADASHTKKPKKLKIKRSKPRKNKSTNENTCRSSLGILWSRADPGAATAASRVESWHVGVLKGSQAGETLDDFMQRKVFPDDEYKEKSKELVNWLVKFLQYNTRFSVDKVCVVSINLVKDAHRINSPQFKAITAFTRE